ncbi:MAG TPA: hopanoid biosynthesis-associated protein HpnK, partial [Candidatus Binataceae bacterium]|nr:hopanoid biosynthesis-associated protein HpnK [Candidatus Binataceae bacterium]
SLVITGDDFGCSREVNAGVIRAFREGVLTGTSLMVAGAARDEAAALAREHRQLDVGLHLVVCRGHSVLAADRLGGIVDAAARFSESPVGAGLRYFFDRRVRSALRDEIRAQIETHLELTGYLNHLDGHLNFHVHPVVADIVIEAAGEYRIPCMRLPREPVTRTLRLARDHASRKLIESLIFRTLSRRLLKRMRAHGIRTTNRLFGLHQTGFISEDYVAGVIARMSPGTTEFYFHPAQDIGGTPPALAAQLEVRVLTSQRIREALGRAGVRLTSFAEIARNGTMSSPDAKE